MKKIQQALNIINDEIDKETLKALNIINDEIDERLMVLRESYQEGEDGYKEMKRMEQAMCIVYDYIKETLIKRED